MEEIRDKSFNAGEAKKARETAQKMAARGDSAEEIADMVGYDTKIVTAWLQEAKVHAEQ